jgi:predicted glutamine amidotransferase
MCRIAISIGNGGSLYPIYPEIIKGLYGAAKYDPYSIDLFGEGEESHRDGWGRLNIQILNQDISISLLKSLKPVYEERPPIRLSLSPFEDFIKHSFFIDMFHARAGSTGMPRNIFSVHPFQDETKNGNLLFLLHNGAVYKEPILRELKIDRESEYAKRYTDSYFLTKYIASILEDRLDHEVIRDISRFVKTALNLGIVLVGEGYLDVLVGSYYLKGDKPDALKNYYKIYRANIGDTSLYVSSTIVDFPEYRPKSISQWREVINGEYEIIRIDYIHGFSIKKEAFKVKE